MADACCNSRWLGRSPMLVLFRLYYSAGLCSFHPSVLFSSFIYSVLVSCLSLFLLLYVFVVRVLSSAGCTFFVLRTVNIITVQSLRTVPEVGVFEEEVVVVYSDTWIRR